MLGLRTLVLHPDYSVVNLFPLYTIPVEDAIVRVLQGNAFVAETYDRKVLTPSRTDLFWPSIVINKKFYKRYSDVQLRKETLFYRDHGLCMYCEQPLTPNTITCDHVMPKDKGGHHGWDNVVAACKPCNATKANHLPKGKWTPKVKPRVPTVWELIENRRKFPITVDDPNWINYIGVDGEWPGGAEIRHKAARLLETEYV